MLPHVQNGLSPTKPATGAGMPVPRAVRTSLEPMLGEDVTPLSLRGRMSKEAPVPEELPAMKPWSALDMEPSLEEECINMTSALSSSGSNELGLLALAPPALVASETFMSSPGPGAARGNTGAGSEGTSAH